MNITLTFTDHAAAGLQRVAENRGHEDVRALCYATMIEIAGAGCAGLAAEEDAALLAKLKAAPKAVQDQVGAVKLAEAEIVNEEK